MERSKLFPHCSRDTLMGCFALYLTGSEARQHRLCIRNKVLTYLFDHGHVNHQFVLRNHRESYVEDKHLFCLGFAKAFVINVGLRGEDTYINTGSRYTLFIEDCDHRFCIVLPAARPKMSGTLYDLRVCSEGRCDVVGTFEPQGNSMHHIRLYPELPNQTYGVHPHLKQDEVLIDVPRGQVLYVFLDGKCITSLRRGDDVHPRFLIPDYGKHMELVILMAPSKTLAEQYLQMELQGRL